MLAEGIQHTLEIFLRADIEAVPFPGGLHNAHKFIKIFLADDFYFNPVLYGDADIVAALLRKRHKDLVLASAA